MNPPRRAIQFLRWFCREDYLDEIEGDLTEVYNKQYDHVSAQSKVEIFVERYQILQAGVYEVV